MISIDDKLLIIIIQKLPVRTDSTKFIKYPVHLGIIITQLLLTARFTDSLLFYPIIYYPFQISIYSYFSSYFDIKFQFNEDSLETRAAYPCRAHCRVWTRRDRRPTRSRSGAGFRSSSTTKCSHLSACTSAYMYVRVHMRSQICQ